MPASRSRTGGSAIRAPSAASSGSSPQRRVRSASTPRRALAIVDERRGSDAGMEGAVGHMLVLLVSSSQRAWSSRLQLDADHAHQAVGQLGVAFELGGMGDDHQAVVEIDDRSFLQVLVGDLVVDRLALLELAGLARIVEPLVDVLVAEVPVVLRRAALVEDVAVAVGIDAARSSR